MIQQRNAVRATDEPLSTSRDRRVAIFKRKSVATVTWYRLEMPDTYDAWVAEMDARNRALTEYLDYDAPTMRNYYREGQSARRTMAFVAFVVTLAIGLFVVLRPH